MGVRAMSFKALSVSVVALCAGLWFAGSQARAAGAGPCVQIRQACLSAGFVQGGGKQGNGLQADCIAPIMKGVSQPPKASIPLPQVDPAIVAACKAQNPNFGQPGAQAAGQGQGQGGRAGRKAQAAARAKLPPTADSMRVPEQPAPLPPGAHRGPNIVFILADDFSMNLIGARVLDQSMPNLAQMMREGATFSRYFVTDSLCCPSRSSIFTGKLPHDTGVYTNTPPWGGYAGFEQHGNEAQTFAVSLHAAGYHTAMMGKYLNGYEPNLNGAGQGWSEWDVDGDKGYAEFNYPLNQNGQLVQHPEYLTDEVSSLGQAFIDSAQSGPFFIEIATFAPHAPYIPPTRYQNDFPNLAYDRSPPFGARPDANAPGWLKEIPPLASADIANIDKYFRMRVQSDKAIDDMIGAIRAELKKLGIEQNTYVVFSADNGYHMGEYSLRPGKMSAFDTDIRVPLIVVGPGVVAGRTVDEIAENTDLCPTFTELAGAAAPPSADGHSLVELLRNGSAPPGQWRRMALVEHHHPGPDKTDPDLPEPKSGNPPSYEAIRTENALYVEYSDTTNEIEYYDLKSDPLELHNIAGSLPPGQLKKLRDALHANTACKGAQACWAAQRMEP
jgi:arylsulfatase A-like enzyme